MGNYYLAALVSLAGSFLLTSCLIKLAKRWQIFIPSPKSRDSHRRPTPRIGGLAIVVTFLIVTALWQSYRPADLDFTDQTTLGVDRNLLGLSLAVVLLSAVNLADDYDSVVWPLKLLTQILAGLTIAWFGIRILWLSNPFGGPLILGGVDWLFVVAWLVVLSNVMNWLDGINGLSGGVGAIALAVLFFLSIRPEVNQPANAMLAAIAFGAVLGFLPFNLGSKVFLGDTGSVFLGFVIGVMAIVSGGKIATAFLVLAIPFLDALVVFFSRLIHRRSPFLPDRRHLHHRLLELGWRPWQIVGLFYLVSLLFGLIALNTQTLGKFWAIIAALGLMIGFVSLYSLLGYFHSRDGLGKMRFENKG